MSNQMLPSSLPKLLKHEPSKIALEVTPGHLLHLSACDFCGSHIVLPNYRSPFSLGSFQCMFDLAVTSPAASTGSYGSYYGAPTGSYGSAPVSPPAPLFGPPVVMSPKAPATYGSTAPSTYAYGSYSYSSPPAPGVHRIIIPRTSSSMSLLPVIVRMP